MAHLNLTTLDPLFVLPLTLVQDPARHKDVDALLGPVPDERFAQLVALGKMITDFSAAADAAAVGGWVGGWAGGQAGGRVGGWGGRAGGWGGRRARCCDPCLPCDAFSCFVSQFITSRSLMPPLHCPAAGRRHGGWRGRAG